MTDQELGRSIERVVTILDNAGVPDDLRPVAFTAAWAAVVSQTGKLAPPQNNGEGTTETLPAMEILAKRLGVHPNVIADNYELQEDGTLAVRVPHSRLTAEKAAGTRELALLVAAGKQFATDATTPLTEIREVCRDYGRLDSPNFSKHLKGGDQMWSVRDKSLRLRVQGWDAAAALLRRIGGAG